MTSAPRFRFAPTPSRLLHVGNALAALLGWGLARLAGGRFVLRIEDIDRARCRPEYDAACLADLAWLGIDWDEGPDVGGPFGPYRQSERLDRYDAAIAGLVARDLAYPCNCSRAEVRAAWSAPHSGDAGERPYPGTCRPAIGRAPVALRGDRGGFRLAVTQIGAAVRWVDGFEGPRVEDLRESCGDFLLGRPGQPTYQLAVVVDDVAMQVTDVVRGRDLIDSTARQIALHTTFGAPPPRFTHHPLILDGGGRKLSKRDGAIALQTWRESGGRAARLIALAGRAVGLFAETVAAATPADVVSALAERPQLHDGPWVGDLTTGSAGVG